MDIQTDTKKVVVLFIGGAGDKDRYLGREATKIVQRDVQWKFSNSIKILELGELCKTLYLGYNEIKSIDDIENNVLRVIPNKRNTAICVVGHSFGGWNGAHLSQILWDKGYNVDMLITLDPVGTRRGVKLISGLYWKTPYPKANYWINVNSVPKDHQRDDFIATLGGQWKPKSGMQINYTSNCHHRQAGLMFMESLNDENGSCSDVLQRCITNYLSE